MADAKLIDDAGEVKPKRRFDQRDFDYIAEYVCDEYSSRRQRRTDRERNWKEIDRQIAMEPDNPLKFIIKNGSRVADPGKAWMAEMEPPYQAQALEVLTADARRLFFPDSGPWFSANAEVTDDYLAKLDYKSLIKGDGAEVPSRVTQGDVNKITEAFILNQFAQMDFRTRIDKIDAETLKYGMGVGRARIETKSVFIHEARGVMKENRKIPVLVPCSIRNVYLDEPGSLMHSAQVLSESHIYFDRIKLANLHIAAAKGSKDPDDPDGGWMTAGLKGIKADDDGYVTLLEMEGDIVVPRKTTRSMVLPGCIVTVILGSSEANDTPATRGVVRFRWRKYPFSSYVLFPYHHEGAHDRYATSPLMKGRPIQIAIAHAMNRLMDSAALKNMPPVSYDANDQTFAANGGPMIYPGANWKSVDPASIKVHTEVGGEPGALMGIFSSLVSMYAELTGVLPSRLGAQTVSHTTAYAKGAEIQRGASRTVDFVNSSGDGPMTRWLDMAYTMGRDIMKGPTSFFIPSYGGFVEVTKDQLPENVVWQWHGAGGPLEEQQKRAQKMQSLSMAMQMDQVGAAYGKPPRVNLDGAIDQTLRDGGWTDIDAVVNPTAPAGALPALPPPAQQQDLFAALGGETVQ